MQDPILHPTRLKESPSDPPGIPDDPKETEIVSENLNTTPTLKRKPKVSKLIEETPDVTPPLEETPEPTPPKEEMPTDLNMENVVVINGKQVEIKPTKVKYFRNKTVACYGYIKAIPLTEFLSYDVGVLNKTKSADQLLYDFLVAVFDDSAFVRDNYDEMTAANIDEIVKIFGRLNNIDEKEEAARKNREAQGNR